MVFNTIVVDSDSAKIRDTREEAGTIPANHSKMTKFESSDDVGFKRISAQLRRWVQELRTDQAISQKDYIDCKSSLETVDTKLPIANVRDAHEKTFHWLFDPSVVSFSGWLEDRSDSSQPFYWIQGKPGSGKSTLMNFALRDSRTVDFLGRESEPPWIIVAFFFHDRGTSILQKSLSGLLREILSSILSKLSRLVPLAVAIYKKLVKKHGRRRYDWELEDLAALMRLIVEQRETRIRLLLFFDALDEHERDNEQLVQMLQKWRESADGYYVNLKVCLASRPWNIFTEFLGDGPNFAIHHHTKEDIHIYTNSRLGTFIPGGSRNLLEPSS